VTGRKVGPLVERLEPAAVTGRKVGPLVERLARVAATGREVGPLVERSAQAAGPRLQAHQVFDPPAEPQLRPSGFWVEFFELLAKSTALFDL
jgi:hypothetical protein